MELPVKFQEYILLIIGIGLIIIHGLWASIFVIDGITITLLIIIAIPFLANYLTKAKIFGAEFEFKPEILATEKLVELSLRNAIKSDTLQKTKQPEQVYKVKQSEIVQKTKQLEKEKTAKRPPQFAVFDLTSVNELIKSDPVLALAALRIEIEKKLRLASEQFGVPKRQQFYINTMLDALMQKEIFHSEQIEAIKNIQNMCNKAVHGSKISQEDAEKIVKLAENLNKSFSIGYWINFEPNADYENQGLFCEWEHCIEHFPLPEEPTEKSCKVFGHDCPGGPEQVKKCGKTYDEFPKNRFRYWYSRAATTSERKPAYSSSSRRRRKFRPSK